MYTCILCVCTMLVESLGKSLIGKCCNCNQICLLFVFWLLLTSFDIFWLLLTFLHGHSRWYMYSTGSLRVPIDTCFWVVVGKNPGWILVRFLMDPLKVLCTVMYLSVRKLFTPSSFCFCYVHPHNLLAKTTLPSRVFCKNPQQIFPVHSRPMFLQKNKFTVCNLP